MGFLENPRIQIFFRTKKKESTRSSDPLIQTVCLLVALIFIHIVYFQRTCMHVVRTFRVAVIPRNTALKESEPEESKNLLRKKQ